MTDMPAPTPPEKHYSLAIRRPVTMVMLFLTLIVFGYKSYQELPINLMPDISYPTLTVRTEYEGAAPADVEKLLTRPLEETLSIVSGMVEISSISSAGLSEIVLEFTWDTDMNMAQQDVRDRLDLFDPPREVTEKPVILRYDPTLDPVLRVAISGEDVSGIEDPILRRDLAETQLTEIREAADRHIKSDLEAEVGIAQVLVKGGREKEIQVRVDAERVKNLGMSLQTIMTALTQQNINLSGGRLREGKTEFLVRTKNEWVDVSQIQASIIGSANGQQIRLEDVADVFVGEKERETIVHINGQEAVGLEIYKEGDANTVRVCNQLKDILGFERKRGSFERMMQAVKDAREKGGAPEDAEKANERELAKTVRSRLPKNAQLALISDQSRFIIASIKEVQSATILGGLLALGILYLFLRDIKSTMIIGISIPISVIATFIPMFARHISLNIMSLGGLALGVGMLVDNSIVVLESIFRCREEGDNAVDAAERGTKEVGSAVTASTLTTVAVFLPIAFVEGIAGQLFGDLALTVTFSLLASLLVALYLIPMIASRKRMELSAGQDVVWMLHAYRDARTAGAGAVGAAARVIPRGVLYAGQWLKETISSTFGPSVNAFRALGQGISFRKLARCLGVLVILPLLVVLFPLQVILKTTAVILTTVLFVLCAVVLGVWIVSRAVLRVVLWLPLTLFELGFNAFRDSYAAVLRQSLRFSPVIILLVLAVALHAGRVGLSLGRELIPPLKQGEFGIRMEAPPGTRLEETERHARTIETLLRDYPDVASVTVEIGKADARGTGNRGENVAEFTVLLKNPEANAVRQDDIIDALRGEIEAVSNDEIMFTLPALFSFKTAVEVQIRGDDLDILKEVGQRALEAIRDIKGLKDPELSVKQGYPEIIVELDRDLLAAKNLSPMDVAQRLRNEVQGEVPTRFNEAGEKVDIRVRADQARLRSVDDLRNLSVVDSYPPIPLSSVAKSITIREGPSEIRRVDQREVVLISANVTGIDLGAVSHEIMSRLSKIKKPEDYVILLGGQNRELEVSYQSLKFALLLAIFLVYVVMACQFESMLHPAIVMFSVPLAFIGVVYVLKWLSIDLSIVVFIGGIVLAGIVVNDAIVLVDYINQLRARGMKKADAIVLAGRVRLRPILMTTITTVLGLLPMAMYSGEGAEMRRPMAVTVMAGLSSATILTLIIIPMVYYLFGGRDKQRTEP